MKADYRDAMCGAADANVTAIFKAMSRRQQTQYQGHFNELFRFIENVRIETGRQHHEVRDEPTVATPVNTDGGKDARFKRKPTA